MAGLMRVTLCQFTTLKENGILSRFTLSDSIFIGCYFNDIGYHGETYFDEDDVYDYRGAAVACGPNFGNSFIGGKIEYCRIGVHMVATSWLTMTGMWFDIFKRAAIVAIGDGSGYGVNNIFSSLKINGAGSLKMMMRQYWFLEQIATWIYILMGLFMLHSQTMPQIHLTLCMARALLLLRFLTIKGKLL